MQALLGRHRIDLVRRHAIGEYSIEIEGSPDSFGCVRPVAGDHDDTRDAGGPQRLHGAGRLTPELVAEQKGADHAAIDGHKDA